MNEALLALIIAPATSVLTLVIQSFAQRRSTKGQEKVGLKTARNGEMDIAFDGLQANMNAMLEQLKEVRGELRETKAEAQKTQVELDVTRSDLRRLESVVGELRIERVQFLNWIADLEKLIPDPPGAPDRPAWMNLAQ